MISSRALLLTLVALNLFALLWWTGQLVPLFGSPLEPQRLSRQIQPDMLRVVTPGPHAGGPRMVAGVREIAVQAGPGSEGADPRTARMGTAEPVAAGASGSGRPALAAAGSASRVFAAPSPSSSQADAAPPPGASTVRPHASPAGAEAPAGSLAQGQNRRISADELAARHQADAVGSRRESTDRVASADAPAGGRVPKLVRPVSPPLERNPSAHRGSAFEVAALSASRATGAAPAPQTAADATPAVAMLADRACLIIEDLSYPDHGPPPSGCARRRLSLVANRLMVGATWSTPGHSRPGAGRCPAEALTALGVRDTHVMRTGHLRNAVWSDCSPRQGAGHSAPG
ncbi:MAG: hypothetical protein R3E83_24325 [Burkholderiaceae bacterium]